MFHTVSLSLQNIGSWSQNRRSQQIRRTLGHALGALLVIYTLFCFSRFTNKQLDIHYAKDNVLLVSQFWEQTGGALLNFLDLLEFFEESDKWILEPYLGHSNEYKYSALNAFPDGQGALPLFHIIRKDTLLQDNCFPRAKILNQAVDLKDGGGIILEILYDQNQASRLKSLKYNAGTYVTREPPTKARNHSWGNDKRYLVGSKTLKVEILPQGRVLIPEWRGLQNKTENFIYRIPYDSPLGREKYINCIKLTNDIQKSFMSNIVKNRYGAVHVRFEWFLRNSNQTAFDLASTGNDEALKTIQGIVYAVVQKSNEWANSSNVSDVYILGDFFEEGSSTFSGLLHQFKTKYQEDLPEFVLKHLSHPGIVRPNSGVIENRALLGIRDAHVLNTATTSIRFGSSSLTKIFAPVDSKKHVAYSNIREII